MGIKEYLKEKEIDKKAKQALAGLLATGAILTGATACVKDDPIITDPIDVVDPNDNTKPSDIDNTKPSNPSTGDDIVISNPNVEKIEESVGDVEDKLSTIIPDFELDQFKITVYPDDACHILYIGDSGAINPNTWMPNSYIQINVSKYDQEELYSEIVEFLEKGMEENRFEKPSPDAYSYTVDLAINDMKNEEDLEFMGLVQEALRTSDSISYMNNGTGGGKENPFKEDEKDEDNTPVIAKSEAIKYIENKIQVTIPGFNFDKLVLIGKSETENRNGTEIKSNSIYVYCLDSSTYDEQTNTHNNQAVILVGPNFVSLIRTPLENSYTIEDDNFRIDLSLDEMNDEKNEELMKGIKMTTGFSPIFYLKDGKEVAEKTSPELAD